MAVASSGTAVVTLPTNTQILITRDFDAPRHLVYKAWTTPELIKRWWSAKRGEVMVADVDLRVGGTWRWVMVTDDGFEVAFHGEYRELIPNERIVSTEVYEGMPEADAEALNTLTLRDREILLLWDAGLSYPEIAAQTGLAVGAVGTTLARARRRLVEAHDRQQSNTGTDAAHS